KAAGKCAKNSKPSPKKTDPGIELRKRLGITDDQMAGVPIVTDRVIAGAGSRGNVIITLRADDSEEARSLIEAFDSLNGTQQGRVSFEELFTAAGLTSRRFVEVVTGALMQQAQDVSRMMIAVAQPKVSKQLIAQATKRKPDLKAIELFGKMSNMLPTP